MNQIKATAMREVVVLFSFHLKPYSHKNLFADFHILDLFFLFFSPPNPKKKKRINIHFLVHSLYLIMREKWFFVSKDRYHTVVGYQDHLLCLDLFMWLHISDSLGFHHCTLPSHQKMSGINWGRKVSFRGLECSTTGEIVTTKS